MIPMTAISELVTQLIVAQERARAEQLGLFAGRSTAPSRGRFRLPRASIAPTCQLAGGGPPASAGPAPVLPPTAATSSIPPQ